MNIKRVLPIVTVLGLVAGVALAEPMRLPDDPALSPDGKQLAFSWNGDIWLVPSQGGTARRLTSWASRERSPRFSPDGTTVALISDREGAPQVFLVPSRGGLPQQLTFHSEGCDLEEWAPDGNSLLIRATRDHFWRHAERLFQIGTKPRPQERLLFDDYGQDASLSPDGKHVLFTREGVAWWRKGYLGSQASQIWKYSVDEKRFAQVCNPPSGAHSPLWHPGGKQFFYVGGQSGSFNLWRRDLETGQEQQLTRFDDDSVIMPCTSRDGKVIVFRHLFDFYRLEPEGNGKPRRIRLEHRGDQVRPPQERITLNSATQVAFSADGLEVAFVAGGDLWVMDTVLREPKRITNTPGEERDPVFAPDGKSLLFASDAEKQSDLWMATRYDPERYWWQNDSFPLKRLSEDPDHESDLRWSPDGSHVAFIKGAGELWVMEPSGEKARRILESWNAPDFDWSPDGRWIVYAVSDNEFNRDVFVLPLHDSRVPFNLSRHPDNDSGPVWSPDGKIIAFTGRRLGFETDIYFVYLQKSEDELDSRDRKLEEAMDKLKKARKSSRPATPPPGKQAPVSSAEKPPAQAKTDEPPAVANQAAQETPSQEEAAREKPKVVIDFEDIDQRIRRVAIPDAAEVSLFWSHDSKKLAFTATIEGKPGTYTIAPPAELSPKLLSTSIGTQGRWIAQGNQIVWLSGGVPGSLAADGKTTAYSFSVRQEVDIAEKYETVFELCWREMRDKFYDANLNHRDWDAIRRKYATLARDAADVHALSAVVNLMLGELNGSHLGFSPTSTASRDGSPWRAETAHLGVRFDGNHPGPGLLIRDLLHKSPADKARSQLHPGEVILVIDEVKVGPETELTEILNGPLNRDVHLRVRDKAGKEREVTLRPISFSAARSLLYDQWVRDNRASVAKMSKDRLGYIHIAGMNMDSFYHFERELYAAGEGKDGLAIDVRENGGGSTTDHLLTVLTQPEHAITVPRGGGPGYPQDRKVYATWNKPIVVLCNQNSFSNAEIFSHAIRTLQRGKLVGVPTAGGVLSTGGTRILDAGFLRLPTRGWYVLGTGQDMELNGAVPDHVLWPEPGDMPAGKDVQLAKAVEVLQQEVAAWKQKPRPPLVKASERKKE